MFEGTVRFRFPATLVQAPGVLEHETDMVAIPELAYFSMEIAIDPTIPTYAGGLGILAGDTVIKEWYELHPHVTKVIGLEQMLDGELPRTPSHHSCLLLCVNPSDMTVEPTTEPFALIMVRCLSAIPQLGDDLPAHLDGYPCGVQSPDFFEFINR